MDLLRSARIFLLFSIACLLTQGVNAQSKKALNIIVKGYGPELVEAATKIESALEVRRDPYLVIGDFDHGIPLRDIQKKIQEKQFKNIDHVLLWIYAHGKTTSDGHYVGLGDQGLDKQAISNLKDKKYRLVMEYDGEEVNEYFEALGYGKKRRFTKEEIAEIAIELKDYESIRGLGWDILMGKVPTPYKMKITAERGMKKIEIPFKKAVKTEKLLRVIYESFSEIQDTRIDVLTLSCNSGSLLEEIEESKTLKKGSVVVAFSSNHESTAVKSVNSLVDQMKRPEFSSVILDANAIVYLFLAKSDFVGKEPISFGVVGGKIFDLKRKFDSLTKLSKENRAEYIEKVEEASLKMLETNNKMGPLSMSNEEVEKLKKYMLDSPPENVQGTSDKHFGGVMLMSYYADVPGVITIAQKKADTKLYKGLTTEDLTSEKRLVMVKEAIAQGADVNYFDSHTISLAFFGTKFLNSPLTEAVKIGEFELVYELVESGADISFKGTNDETVFLEAVASRSKDSIKIVDYLIEKGADIYVKNKYQEDAMLIAAGSANVPMLEYLASNTDLPKDSKGKYDNDVMIEYLRSTSHDENGDFNGFDGSQIEDVKKIVELFDIKLTGEYGEEVMYKASKRANVIVFNYLAEKFYDDDERFAYAEKFGGKAHNVLLHNMGLGIHVLHGSVSSQNNVELMKYLIDIGVDVSIWDFYDRAIADYQKNLAMHEVAERGTNFSPELIEMLVNSGADVNAKNKKEKSPLELAIENEYYETASVLMDYGADPLETDEYDRNMYEVLLEQRSEFESGSISLSDKEKAQLKLLKKLIRSVKKKIKK